MLWKDGMTRHTANYPNSPVGSEEMLDALQHHAFKYFFGARSDFELLIAISNGVLFSPKHSWWCRIADEDMLLVTASVRAPAPDHPYF